MGASTYVLIGMISTLHFGYLLLRMTGYMSHKQINNYSTDTQMRVAAVITEISPIAAAVQLTQILPNTFITFSFGIIFLCL